MLGLESADYEMYWEEGSIKPAENPFKLTTILSILIVLATFFTLRLPEGIRQVFIFWTAPFNMSVEGDIAVNFAVAVIILASAELYLKATRRNKQIMYAFISGIISSYLLGFYLLGVLHVELSGTSVLAFSVLLFLIIALLADLGRYIKHEVLMDRNIFSIIKAFSLCFVAAVVLWYLQQALFVFYIVENKSVYLHLYGGAVSMLILFAILKIKKLPLSKVKV